MTRKGNIIVFEGPDGCGKTSQAQSLVTSLTKDGYIVYHTSFPSKNSVIGKTIRDIILTSEFDNMKVEEIQLLFLHEQINFFKSLEKVRYYYDYIVIDRSYLSTIIYSTCFKASLDFIDNTSKICKAIIPEFDYLFVLGKNYIEQSIEKVAEDKIEQKKEELSISYSLYYDEKFIKNNIAAKNVVILEHKTKQKNKDSILEIIKQGE